MQFLNLNCAPVINNTPGDGIMQFCCLWSCSLELSYQLSFETYLLHLRPVSAAISKLNFFVGRMALIHCSTFVIRLGGHNLLLNYLLIILSASTCYVMAKRN